MNVGDCMKGIDLNKQIIYLHSSLRFFDKKEHHINRFCEENVLLLVYEGVLRFSEDGIERQQKVRQGKDECARSELRMQAKGKGKHGCEPGRQAHQGALAAHKTRLIAACNRCAFRV